MTVINIWERRRYPLEKWTDGDPRLSGVGDVADLLEAVYCYVWDDLLPFEQRGGDQLPGPVEMVNMLRQAAQQIEEWTDPRPTL